MSTYFALLLALLLTACGGKFDDAGDASSSSPDAGDASSSAGSSSSGPHDARNAKQKEATPK